MPPSFVALARGWALQAKLFLHLTADLLRLLPMHARPYRSAGDKADAVPDDMKMLPSVLYMFDNDSLVVKHLVAIDFLGVFNNFHQLGIC